MKRRQRGRIYTSTDGSRKRSASEWGLGVGPRVIKRSDPYRVGRAMHRFEGRTGDAGAGANRTERWPVRRKSRRRFSEAVSRSGPGGRRSDAATRSGDGRRSLLPVRPRRNRPPEPTRSRPWRNASQRRPLARHPVRNVASTSAVNNSASATE